MTSSGRLFCVVPVDMDMSGMVVGEKRATAKSLESDALGPVAALHRPNMENPFAGDLGTQ